MQNIVVNIQELDGADIYTFFLNGIIVEIPTRWIKFISQDSRYSLNTIRQYAENTKSFLQWVVDHLVTGMTSLDIKLRCLSHRELQLWVKYKLDNGNSPSTVRNRESTVKVFISWMKSSESGRLIPEDSGPYRTDKYISPKPQSGRAKIVTEKEVICLINGYLNESERCLAHFLYDTGLRFSEARNLLASHLPNESLFPQGLKYYPLYVDGVKGRGRSVKKRVVLISAPVLARIRRYHNLPEYRFAFGYDNKSKPAFLTVNGIMLSNRNLNKQMKSAAERAKLDKALYSPHTLRHGAAYSILRSELGENYLDRFVLAQQLLGHSSIHSTEIYASIPLVILEDLSNRNPVNVKYEEAKRIVDNTYLPSFEHSENRGHSQSQKAAIK